MSRRYVYPGACHCRNLEVWLESDKTPAELGVRRDTCSFCTKHHAVYTSDPAGEVRLACQDVSLVERYRFGTRTAEFLLCKACGVFVAAIMPEPAVAVVNVNVLDACTALLAQPISVLDVEGESVEQRLTRRLARWTPVRSFFAATVAVVAVALAGAMGGCAPFQSANVRIVPRVDGRLDVDLRLIADRKPPNCELVGPEVRAAIDGVLQGPGAASRPVSNHLPGRRPPLPAVRCEGVSRCGFQRALAPNETELTLTVR